MRLLTSDIGGSNPAIRTLFYRLARLLSLAIEPVFVFDGPRKPVFKRNKRSIQGDRTSAALAKRLINLFGFVAHDAPGEAEAECALLQRHGVVDAVLSEDVDTIMFGCTKTLRNWTAEGKGSKTPTHVSVYGVDDEGFRNAGLEREGMVLVALMSGGDYLPEGIPRCGPKVACEAARAGFGKSLCKIKRSDAEGLRAWKEKLVLELRANESGYFRTKHKALAIPDGFPNLDVLRYYTHPVVSDIATVERLKNEGQWSRGVNMVEMRKFVEETFDWTYRIGADKLIRVIAPSVLVQKLMARYQYGNSLECSEETAEHEESALIRKISGRRAHFSTDGISELRVQFIPADIAGLDLSLEQEEEVASYGRDGLALNSDEELEEEVAAPKKRFDPTATDALWIAEAILKLGAPLMVEDFEAEERRKLERKKPKAMARKKQEAPPAKTLDGWVKTTKASAPRSTTALSPKKSKIPALPRARSAVAEKAVAKEAPASPRPKSKPQQASSPHRLSQLPCRTSAPRDTTPAEPILLSSSPACPATPPPKAVADLQAGGAGGEADAGEAGSVPRLRMPPGPDDTPPWLKDLCEGKTRQGTLDAFLKSPSRTQEAKRASPKAKVKTGVQKQELGTLFGITKKGRMEKSDAMGRRPAQAAVDDPFIDSSPVDLPIGTKASRKSEVSVIDLTGDD